MQELLRLFAWSLGDDDVVITHRCISNIKRSWGIKYHYFSKQGIRQNYFGILPDPYVRQVSPAKIVERVPEFPNRSSSRNCTLNSARKTHLAQQSR